MDNKTNYNIHLWINELYIGNTESKNKIIDYYTNYIINFINNNFKEYSYIREELIQSGIEGLIYTINNYKSIKKNMFSNSLRYNIQINIRKKLDMKRGFIQQLANKMNKGDIIARQHLIKYYTEYIEKNIKKNYSNSKYDIEDLILAGGNGLLNGIKNYKLNESYHFSTFIIRYIQNEIKEEIKKQKIRKNNYSIGVNKFIFFNNDCFDYIDELIILENAIKKLPNRNKEVLYFHVWRNCTFEEISKVYNLTRQRVEQIYKQSIELLKEEILNPNNKKNHSRIKKII